MAMVLFEGVTVWGLLQMLRLLGMRREWVLVYAWMPMLIWEIGGSGHLDSLVMGWMVLALLFRYRRQPVWTGVFLGLAVLTKFYPLVLFPALYQRGDWKMPATIAGLAALLYAPYLSVGKMVFGFLGGYVQEEGMETGTRYFPLEYLQHLPGLHGVSNTAYMAFAAVVFLALMLWAWQTGCRRESTREAFLWPAFGLALALMLLFSPHYPWYVAWLVPFMVLLPTLTVTTYVGGLFYLCTTALAVGSGPKQFKLNEILYSAVLIAFVLEIVLRKIPTSRRWIETHIPGFTPAWLRQRGAV
jgi:alpha-1,6-mannosyltransferase